MNATEPVVWVQITVLGRYRDHWRVAVRAAGRPELHRAGVRQPDNELAHYLPTDMQAFGDAPPNKYATAFGLDLLAEGWDRDSRVDWTRVLVLMDWCDEHGVGVIVSEGVNAVQPGRYPVLKY